MFGRATTGGSTKCQLRKKNEADKRDAASTRSKETRRLDNREAPNQTTDSKAPEMKENVIGSAITPRQHVHAKAQRQTLESYPVTSGGSYPETHCDISLLLGKPYPDPLVILTCRWRGSTPTATRRPRRTGIKRPHLGSPPPFGRRLSSDSDRQRPRSSFGLRRARTLHKITAAGALQIGTVGPLHQYCGADFGARLKEACTEVCHHGDDGLIIVDNIRELCGKRGGGGLRVGAAWRELRLVRVEF